MNVSQIHDDDREPVELNWKKPRTEAASATLAVTLALGLFFVFSIAPPFAFNLAGASVEFLLVLTGFMVSASVTVSPSALAALVFPRISQGGPEHQDHRNHRQDVPHRCSPFWEQVTPSQLGSSKAIVNSIGATEKLASTC
jgi:hypothetical protein